MVAVQPVLDRSSVWERGTDPMTRATVTGGYDDYGRPHQTIQIAVPRGRNPHLTSPGASPYLATTTLTDYATRDDDTHYLINRVSLQQRLELTEDTEHRRRRPDHLRLPAAGRPAHRDRRERQSADLDLLRRPRVRRPAHPANSATGGCAPASNNWRSPPSILAAAYQGGDPSIPLPPYLAAWHPCLDRATTRRHSGISPAASQATGTRPTRPPTWPAGTPSRTASPTTSSRHGSGRGLAVTRGCDPLGNNTTITYDTYQLLPATVTDPAGLTRSADYDYRVLRPSLVTDPNGNRPPSATPRSACPPGLAAIGKPGASQGDTLDQPGTVFATT